MPRNCSRGLWPREATSWTPPTPTDAVAARNCRAASEQGGPALQRHSRHEGRLDTREDVSTRRVATALAAALDGSLQRLTTDYVDVWQVHAWDRSTPLDETLEALETAVASGRARCVGVSNYSGWQLAKAAASRVTLVSCQMEYSLLERGVERELIQRLLMLRSACCGHRSGGCTHGEIRGRNSGRQGRQLVLQVACEASP